MDEDQVIREQERKYRERKAAEQRKYVQKNPKMAELSQERRKLAVLQKRVNDPEYDAEVKRKAAEKKMNQRRRQKSGFRENELVSDVNNPNKTFCKKLKERLIMKLIMRFRKTRKIFSQLLVLDAPV